MRVPVVLVPVRVLVLVLVLGHGARGQEPDPPPARPAPAAKHVIVCIADGWGYPQVAATAKYAGGAAPYATWAHHAMATWDETTRKTNGGVGYDPENAWSDFGWAARIATDSASSATAMFCGVKTDRGRIGVGVGGRERLRTLGEVALARGLATGAVTSVPISHATPAAWLAHNDDRDNGLAIADEVLFGDPNATGPASAKAHGGGHGPTAPGPTVWIGGGHPGFDRSPYVDAAIRDRLAGGGAAAGGWALVERLAGQRDGGARLLAAAADPATARLAGLFGGKGGNIAFRKADGSGHDPENPTLAEMARAALAVCARDPDGFVLMVEGGAIDWGGHGNALDRCVGEMRGFDEMVAAAVAWVDDPATPATWDDTLVIVTGDHECGYLCPGPRVFPDQPFGEVSPRTLALEKPVEGKGGRRASWEDGNGDGKIDAGEPVYWVWHSPTHTNHLIPLYARGAGAARFAADPETAGTDPKRGRYIDNTAVFRVVFAALGE